MNPIRFTDFEEYASAIRHVDLNVRLIRPSPQRHTWSLQKVELESFQLQFAVEGGGLLAQGKMQRDGWGLYVMLSGAPASVNGQPFGPGSLVVFPPDAEFAISGCGAVRWFAVFVPVQLLVGDSGPPSRNSSVYVPPGQSRLIQRLYSQVRELRCAARLGSSSLHSPAAPLQDDLLSTVRAMVWGGDTSRSAGSTRNAKQLVGQAVELIHDCQEVKLSVRDLAATLHVSERTLLYAFRHHFDVSPQAFLMNHRVHQARKYLRSSDPEQTTVAAAAAKYGFLDFGRFAAKYRQLFGENPSVTLRHPHSRLSAALKAASE